MHSSCRLLPDHIVCKITQRNNIRRENTCDPALKLLNEEITSDIENIWKEHLDTHWDHRHTTHTLWKQFTNTVRYATHKTNRSIDRATSCGPISLLPVIAKTLEKGLLPYITENITNTPTQHGSKTQHSTVTELHTLNKTVAKGFNQNGSSCANNHCSTRYEQSFRHNKHTHTNQKTATDHQSRHNHKTTSRDAKPTQHTETTHPYVNLKLAFPKVASSHPHYLAFTVQIIHYPEHRFRSCPTQMTSPSHLHTQARVQQRNTYNHTYIQFLSGQNNNFTLNPDKTPCTLFTPDPTEYSTLHYQLQRIQRFWVLP